MSSIDWRRVHQLNTENQQATRTEILAREGIVARIREGTERGKTDARPFGRGDFARSLSHLQRGRLEEK